MTDPERTALVTALTEMGLPMLADIFDRPIMPEQVETAVVDELTRLNCNELHRCWTLEKQRLDKWGAEGVGDD